MLLNRLVPPSTRPFGRVELPTADVTRLPNGARLHILPHTAQPVVRLQLVFPAGRWYDPSPGVSLLAARTLLEGTATRTARQIADELAFYGASLECEQGFDRATLTLYCLSRHLEPLLPLVQDIVLNATFPEEELVQTKTRTIQNIRVERQKTGYLAAERFSRNLYGPTHPYGVVFDENAFQAITSYAVRSFHRSAYQLAQAELFLCGDVASSTIKILEQFFGHTADTDTMGENHQQLQVLIQPQGSENVIVPNSLQASLRLGRVWPAASDPDTHRLQLLTKVLGGYFGSRLMKNIREDKGFTYGIYASIAHREHSSLFVIGSDVNASNAATAVAEVAKEMLLLQSELISEDELSTVQNYIAGKFLNELGTVFEQCDKYKSTVMLGLPNDFYTHFIDDVYSTSPETLRNLAQQYLSSTDLVTIVAGPA